MNKLVRTLDALIVVSAAVIVVGCTPEEEPDIVNNTPTNPVSSVKRLSKVTWVYDEGEYSNNQTFTQVINYTWKGDLITNIDAYDEGELVVFAILIKGFGHLLHLVVSHADDAVANGGGAY